MTQIIQPEDNQSDKKDAAIEIAGGILKGIISQVPIAGPVIAEILGIIIPNRRLERILATLALFGQKIEHLDSNLRETRMRTEDFADLLEEGMWQAARAATEERKESIASILANSLEDDELDNLQKKRLLLLLGEINDAEIIMLKYYSMGTSIEKQDFLNTHRNILTMPAVVAGSDQETIDQATMTRNYRNNLLRLSLIAFKFKKPKKNELPEFDFSTGMLETSSVNITNLGRLLLRYIDT